MSLVDSQRLGSGPLAMREFRPLAWWSVPRVLRRVGEGAASKVIGLWLVSVALSVLTGIAVVRFELSALAIPLGLTTVDITVYPPLLVGMLHLLWLGPGWAILSTYLATFALGAYSGLPLASNVIFSLADAILILVVWGGITVLDIPLDFRSRKTWVFYLALVLAGAIGSSMGALVWNHGHGLSFDKGFSIWQGWVVGAFLHAGPLVIPIHMLVGARVRDWVESELGVPERPNSGTRLGVAFFIAALLLTAVIAALVGYLLATSIAASAEPAQVLLARLPELGLFILLVFASILGTTVLLAVALTQRSEREQLRATTDSLTGCLNRAAFDEIYETEAHRCMRLRLPLAVLFLDLDRFKRINDEYGYAIGDHVLREVAVRIGADMRDTDRLFRWGGEEFVLLLPHTGRDESRAVAERVRLVICDSPISLGYRQIDVTASLGAVATTKPEHRPRRILNRAADACRAAKLAGRNKVVAKAFQQPV